MKPPVRQRMRSVRLLGLKSTESKQRMCNTWYKKEQRSLKKGLSLQLMSNLEPDVLELQKDVPKRTLHEIQNLLKFLKASVARRVYQCVQKQKQEEEKIKVPIEMWNELAHKMAAAHEETISTAFSQMLVIAATEPLSKLNSVPPLRTDSMNCEAYNLNATRGIGNRPWNPHGTQLSSVVCQESAKLSTPTVPETNVGQTSLNQSETVPKIMPKPVTFSSSPNLINRTMPRTHGRSVQDQLRSAEKASTVDFGEIYKYINSNITKRERPALTPMESAVLLDLLMSLPEELPLLDCKELQHQLLQVYSSLTSEAKVPISSTDQKSAAAKPAGAEQHNQGTDISLQTQGSQTAEDKTTYMGADSSAGSEQKNVDDISDRSSSVNPPKDSESWATAGLLPLNPFMIPISLLKRQQS